MLLWVVVHAVEEQLLLQVVVERLGSLRGQGVGGGQRHRGEGQRAVRAGGGEVSQAWELKIAHY